MDSGPVEMREVDGTAYGRVLYTVTMAAGVIGPLTNLPQFLKIYIGKDATGVSALSWFLYLLFDIPFILWAILRKDRPVLVTYSLWFVSNLAILVGALVYG